MSTIADISEALGDFMLKGYVWRIVYYQFVSLTRSLGSNRPIMSNAWMYSPNDEDSQRKNACSHLLCEVQRGKIKRQVNFRFGN